MINFPNNNISEKHHVRIEDSKYCLIFCTTPDKFSAHTIAQQLLYNKLAACITLLPDTTSIFYWKGMIEKKSEVQLIIKTDIALQPTVFRKIKDHHTYQVPELLALPIIDGDSAYLSWINNCLK